MLEIDIPQRLKNIIDEYIRAAIRKLPEKDFSEEQQIAYQKVTNLIKESTEREKLIEDLYAFYVIETHVIINSEPYESN